MNSRKFVRVVKRQVVLPSAPCVDNRETPVLEMERTVKAWVQEMRTNQATETRTVFCKLFGKQNLP